jgi:hypothetical protein
MNDLTTLGASAFAKQQLNELIGRVGPDKLLREVTHYLSEAGGYLKAAADLGALSATDVALFEQRLSDVLNQWNDRQR